MTMIALRPAVIDLVPRGERGIPGTNGDYDYANRNLAIAANISPSRKTLRTGGYDIEGDGGDALYVRVGSQPSHIGKFQSADGGWWEIVVDDRLNVCQVGAKTTGDAYAAFNGARGVTKSLLVPGNKRFTLSQPLMLAADEDWKINGRVDGTFTSDGDYFRPYGADLTAAGTVRVWAYPVGTTSLPINGSTIPVGSIVAVRLAPGAGNATVSESDPTEANQGGFELQTVTSSDASHIGFNAPGLRYMYDIPRVQVVNGGFVSGIFTRNTTFTLPIPSTMTVTPGMLVMVMNVNGNDGVRNSLNYFDIKKVASTGGGAMTFETPFEFNMINVMVVEMKSTPGLKIEGKGYIDNVQLKVTDLVDYSGLKARVVGGDSCYGGTVTEMRANSDQPRGLGFSRCFNMQIGKLYSHGSRGETDNAAFKTLGCVNCTFDGYMAYDTASTTLQAIYAVFGDFYVPPFYGWQQNCIFMGGKGGRPSSGADVSATFAGLRDCVINELICANNIRVEYCDGVACASFFTTGQIELKDSIGLQLNNFQCGSLVYSGLKNSIIGQGVVRSEHPSALHGLWVRGGTTNATTNDILTHDVKFLSTNMTADTIGVQACDDMVFRNCSDIQGHSKSFNVLSAGTVGSAIQIEGRGLRNPLDSLPNPYLPTVFGGTVSGTVAYGAGRNSGAQRDGRFISIRGSLVSFTIGVPAPTGDIRIMLPRKAKNSPSAAQQIWATISGIALTGLLYYIRVQPGDNFGTLFQINAAGTEAPVQMPASGTVTLRFGGMYEVENYADGT